MPDKDSIFRNLQSINMELEQLTSILSKRCVAFFRYFYMFIWNTLNGHRL